LSLYFLRLSALLATYLILAPEAFERQLPSEDKPEIAAILNDPGVPQEQKDAMRKQIRFARQNRGKIRDQLAQLASDNNKKVVAPLLPKIRKAFEAAEAEAREALEMRVAQAREMLRLAVEAGDRCPSCSCEQDLAPRRARADVPGERHDTSPGTRRSAAAQPQRPPAHSARRSRR